MSTAAPGSVSTDPRCPRCAAHVRVGADWCTLCYTDLRPAPANLRPMTVASDLGGPVPAHGDLVATATTSDTAALLTKGLAAQQASAEQGPPDAGALTSTTTSAPQRPRGKHARAAQPAVDPEVLAAQMVAELAAAESGSPLGRFESLLDTPGKKIVAMVGGAVAATALFFCLLALMGLLV